MKTLLRELQDWLVERSLPHIPHFERYRPAPRLGTRRIERRLLRRLNWNLTGTSP
jgi:hypothetical protein